MAPDRFGEMSLIERQFAACEYQMNCPMQKNGVHK
jgi:hypothetical protein